MFGSVCFRTPFEKKLGGRVETAEFDCIRDGSLLANIGCTFSKISQALRCELVVTAG